MLRSAIFLFFILNALCADSQILPAFGGSRTGTTGFQFLKIAPDARSTGMAETFIAVVNDVSSVYWNPAGITKVDSQNVHLQLGHTAYFAGTNNDYIGAVHKVGADAYLGYSLTAFNSGAMNLTTEFQPFGTGQTFKVSDISAGITYGLRMTENFCFGATGRLINESIAGINNTNLVFDFGFQYDIGKANTRFAVVVSNFGFNGEPNGSIEHLDLNGIDTVTQFQKVAVPAIFRIGVATDLIKKEEHQFTFAGQLNHPTDNNETLGLGAEYSWHHILYVRSGYQFGMDESGLPAFGFGIRFQRNFGMVNFDYGFQHKSVLGMIHRLTLGISLF